MVKTKRGFTLIEIIIVLAITGAFFSFGYSNYRDYARRQQALASAREIESAINLTKGLALSGNKPAACKLADPELNLNGYRIIFNDAANTYSIVAVCNKTNFTIGKDNLTIASNLDLQVASTNTKNYITYKVIGEGTDVDANLFGISVIRVDIGSSADITVTQAGEGITSASSVAATPTPTAPSLPTPTPTALPTPTPTLPPAPTGNCGNVCTRNADCTGNLKCINSRCVNNSCPSDPDCICN